MLELYDEQDKIKMSSAEESRIPTGSRIEELVKFAKHQNIKKIGIANCAMFAKEAEKLKSILESEFEVFAVGCKTGGITAKEMTGKDINGISCNPAGQAKYLEDNNTELNISMGLCIGHDIVFNSKSKVMTTNLIVKDRKHKHDVMKNFVD